uniref:Putative product n=1 Tax=Xenopsylla cheopis TaxID=163159 RepID=A0A6M2DZM0_XENCH
MTSSSMILPSPSTSLASPSISLASPCMSLQSPLTPHESSAFECKLPVQPLIHQHAPHRNPVGTNPHDINNPLSVNQLTSQCPKNSVHDVTSCTKPSDRTIAHSHGRALPDSTKSTTNTGNVISVT